MKIDPETALLCVIEHLQKRISDCKQLKAKETLAPKILDKDIKHIIEHKIDILQEESNLALGIILAQRLHSEIF